MHDLLLIAVVAAILALDDRAGWQSLAGEPVVSSLIVGLAFGRVGAARGSRRPHAVVGGVVGAAATCLSLHRSGDPREPLVIGAAVFCGLLAGEAAQWLDGRA